MRIALAAAIALLAPGCVIYPDHEVLYWNDGVAHHEVIAGYEPPSLRTELVTVAPSPTHVWVPGYWWWTGRWSWVAGCWILPPRAHAVWTPGRWDHHPRGWVWTRGSWRW